MASYTKPDDRLSEDQLTAIIAAAIPSYAFRNGAREWIWTRISGVWHLNLVFALDHGGPSSKACGVQTWEKLVGRTIYVLTDPSRRVVGIENLPTEPGERFLFAEVFGDPDA